jgi:hypothetical protein
MTTLKVAEGMDAYMPITLGIGIIDVALFYYIRRIISICKGVQKETLAATVEEHAYYLLTSMLVTIFGDILELICLH